MIIGITGKKGSGKDTIAEYLQNKYNVTIESLAEPIKLALNIIFDWDETNWEQGKKEEVDRRWGISPRQAAKHIGTDWAQWSLCADFPLYKQITNRDLWVHRLMDRIWFEDLTAVPDVRFPHEAKAIRESDGIILKVIGGKSKNDDAHPSEMDMEHITPDYTIVNDGTKEDLYTKVDEFIKAFDLENYYCEE